MTDLQSLELRRLQRLFSVVFCIDDDLTITRPSKVALRHMPYLAEETRLHDAFEVVRPRRALTAADLMEQQDALFLMKARDGSFALRGQLVSLHAQGGMPMVFCGSPWLSWLNSEHPELKLGIGDFSSQDSQLDQLFYMSTEKTMLHDLELLTEDLQAAKTQLEASQKARDDFFAQMSHEMRTPLNGVVSALALLEQHKLPERSRELLSLIRSSSHNLMHVINYVLDVSKIEASDAEITPESFVLAELIDSVLEIVEARAREKNLGLSVNIGPGLSRSYLGDAPRLRQTLLNLVTNAINFTDEGQVTVDVATVEGPSPRVRIDISDTGVGIPEAMQDRVFEPFFSATDSVMGQREPGTGLGLDIVRRNVSLMGGELELVSAPGEGSSFSILLPLSPVEEPAEDTDLAVETEFEAAAGPLRGSVLLVDDNRTNLMLGTMLLENLGLKVQGAASGEAAVEAVAKQCFCAVLMDISMPGIDGLEATRRIRELPSRRNLPVIALTAYASSREQARAREAGMNDYLTKPVDRAELVQVLGKWLPAPMAPPQKRKAERPPASIDDAILEGLLKEIGADNFARVVETFSQEARVRWQALATAALPSDMAREAHSLLSTCRSFGLKDLAESLAAIEAGARDGLTEEAASLEVLGRRLEEALNALSTWKPPQHGAACDAER